MFLWPTSEFLAEQTNPSLRAGAYPQRWQGGGRGGLWSKTRHRCQQWCRDAGARRPTEPEVDASPAPLQYGMGVAKGTSDSGRSRGTDPIAVALQGLGLPHWTFQPSQRSTDARWQSSLHRVSGKERFMKHRVVVLLVTLAALVAAAPSALAAPPTHERVPIDDEFTDESCGFPVEIQLTGFVHTITWVNEDGSVRRIEAFPQGKATLTNPETGESITHNAAGPAHVTENPDGSFTLVGTGNWGWPNHPETGEPGIFQLSGRFVLSVDAEGNESFRFVGRFVDLCAELAA
jgi:hypothetical protein